MKNLKFIAALALVVFSMFSCSKYDEGSNFSLRTAKNRIVNKWSLNKLEINNQTQATALVQFTVDIRKDNTFSRTISLFGTVTDSGTWAFTNDKRNLVLTLSNGTVLTYKIIQLKSKSLKVEEKQGNDTYRFTFYGD